MAGGAKALPRLATEGKAAPPLLEIASSSDLAEVVLVLVVVVVVEEESEHRSARSLSTISDGMYLETGLIFLSREPRCCCLVIAAPAETVPRHERRAVAYGQEPPLRPTRLAY